MKKITTLVVMLSVLSIATQAQNKNDEQAVKSTIETFAKGAEQQDVKLLEPVLHSNYRAIFKGPEGVQSLDRASYLGLISAKKIGGAKRTMKIHSVDITETNAIVKVELNNDQMHFVSYIGLMKSADGAWQIVNDQPYLEMK